MSDYVSIAFFIIFFSERMAIERKTYLTKEFMKPTRILAAVCSLAVLVCSCGKNEKTIPVSEVKIDLQELSLAPGETHKLSAVVTPEDADYDAVIWTSSDDAVVTVAEDGTITAVAKGEAVVTAAAGAMTDECTVTVTVPVTGIDIDKHLLMLKTTDAPVQLTATVSPVDATDKTVKWTTTDASVVTVSETGLVTPVAVGSAVIGAEAAGFKVECAVIIDAPAKTWAVGDYYEVNGVKGVVVWTSDNKTHGKIVSMDEAVRNQWDTGCYNTGAKSEDDGKSNTEKVKDLNASLSAYPAFKWCVDHGDGWYFPAISEVYLFMKAKDIIDPVLAAHGGDKLTDYYWSSTEGDEDSTAALYGYFSNGRVSGYSDFKDNPEGDMMVRAMYQF